jgi:hypothetical protein
MLKAELRQVLARHLAEGLALFGRVNGADADGDLFVGTWLAAAGGQGVTVCDCDDEAKKGCVQSQ